MQLPYKRINLLQGLASIIAAILAAAIIVLIFSESQKLYKFAALGALVLPLVIFISGNQRLFFLVGLVFTAPLGLSINFKTLIHIGGSPSYSIDLADFFLIPLIIFLLKDLTFGYRKTIQLPTVSWWWIGLIALGLSSMVIGPYRHLPGFEVLRMIKSLLMFCVIVNECQRIKRIEYVVMALGAGIGLQIIIGFIQFILKRELGLQALGEASPEAIKGANLGVYLTSGNVYRVGALMGHPNLLSAYFALLLPIFVALLFASYSKLVKLLICLLLVGGCITLLMTLSRTGWASFAAAYLLVLLVVTIDPWLRSQHLAVKGIMVSLTIIGGLLASGPVVRRLTQSDEGALDFRYEWMEVALRMVQEKPLIGFGLNTFVYNMAPYTSYGSVAALNDEFGENWPAVHNIYLLVWSEQGSLGLFLFLGFHIHLLRIAIKNIRYSLNDKLHAINIGAACGIIALLIDGMASFFIRVPASNRVFWIVVALIISINYWNKNNGATRFRHAHTTT